MPSALETPLIEHHLFDHTIQRHHVLLGKVLDHKTFRLNVSPGLPDPHVASEFTWTSSNLNRNQIGAGGFGTPLVIRVFYLGGLQ
jgi:hypothetical protein